MYDHTIPYHTSFRLKSNKYFSLFFTLVLFVFFSLPNPSFAAVSFSQDTNLSLTGISDGDILAASGSSADSLSFSGAELTVNAVSDGSYFTLKTPTYSNALKITPSGGTATLTFNTANLSSGAITAWTLNASVSATTIAHIVSAASANTWYAISADGSAYNSYQTNSSGELTFTYSGGFSSSRSFAITLDTTAPTSFSLTSPVHNATISVGLPTFQWNASSDPDFSYYALYIDGSLNTNNLTSNSKTLTSSLNCGSHTWYVKAVDNAGNSTNSSTFNLTIACGGGSPGAVSGFFPQPKQQTIYPDGTVVYQDNAGATETISNNKTQSSNEVQNLNVNIKFSQTLKLGQTNTEIKNLQKTLNQLGFTVAQNGPGSQGKETNYFGKATREAIKKFQCQYDIICQGNENTTGYGLAGAKTRAKLNEMMNQSSTSDVGERSGKTSDVADTQGKTNASAAAISVIQKQIEDLQNQLLEILNNQLKEMTKAVKSP